MIGEVTGRATEMWDEGARWDEILQTLRGEGSPRSTASGQRSRSFGFR
jgi:hypothetical protein